MKKSILYIIIIIALTLTVQLLISNYCTSNVDIGIGVTMQEKTYPEYMDKYMGLGGIVTNNTIFPIKVKKVTPIGNRGMEYEDTHIKTWAFSEIKQEDLNNYEKLENKIIMPFTECGIGYFFKFTGEYVVNPSALKIEYSIMGVDFSKVIINDYKEEPTVKIEQPEDKERFYINGIIDAFNNYNLNVADYTAKIPQDTNPGYERTDKISTSDLKTYDKSLYVNGRKAIVPAFIKNDDVYVSINDLKALTNNLEVEYDEQENLHVFENTGLGVIDYDGKKYIDLGKSVFSKYTHLGIDEAPYFMLASSGYFSILQWYGSSAEMQLNDKVIINDYYYPGFFMDYDEFNNELPNLLKILSANELYLRNHPD